MPDLRAGHVSKALHVHLFGSGSPLHPHAWRYFRDRRRYVLACAGRRGAKTYSAAKKFWSRIWEDDWPRARGVPYEPGAAKRGTSLWWDRRPRLHYWVMAETHALLDEPKRYLLQFLPPELLEHADNSKGRWWLRGDILVEFKSGHTPENVVGSGLDGLWIEEGARLRDDAWNGFIMPLLADKNGWLEVTTTPLGQDWTYRDLYLQALKGVDGYGFHTWRSLDNIRAPHVIEAAARAKETLPDEYYRREWEASYFAFIGQIYKEFGEQHIIDELPANVRLVRRVGGQDWGFGAPGAALVAGITPGERPTFYLLDETYSDEELAEDFWAPRAKEFNAKYKFNEWVADPAEPDQLERFRRAGIRVYRHSNYTRGLYDEHERDVRSGIRTTRILFKQNRIKILRRRCPNLIEELKSYRWARRQGGTSSGAEGPTAGLRERPESGQKDHAATVLRYIVSWTTREGVVGKGGMAAVS